MNVFSFIPCFYIRLKLVRSPKTSQVLVMEILNDTFGILSSKIKMNYDS